MKVIESVPDLDGVTRMKVIRSVHGPRTSGTFKVPEVSYLGRTLFHQPQYVVGSLTLLNVTRWAPHTLARTCAHTVLSGDERRWPDLVLIGRRVQYRLRQRDVHECP